MITTKTKEQKTLFNYSNYLSSCDKIKNSKNFSLKSLQRVLRPTCKTVLLNDAVLTFKLKYTKLGVSITLSPEVINNDTRYLIVRSSKNPSVEYLLSALTIKELMKKINLTYKLLTA